MRCLINWINLFVATQSDTVFLLKDASVWLHHLCKTSALQNRIPKRSVHYWGESRGYFVTSLDKLVAFGRSTWMPMQNNVVNQSFFCSPHLPPPKEVYNGEPACFGERQFQSLKLGCGHFQLFVVSVFKTHLNQKSFGSPFRGMEKFLLISSICLHKGNPANSYLILNFQGLYV